MASPSISFTVTSYRTVMTVIASHRLDLNRDSLRYASGCAFRQLLQVAHFVSDCFQVRSEVL